MNYINWKNKNANALELLESWVIKTPDRRAVVFEPGASTTFGELWELSGKIYAYLKAHHIGAEDVVMYHLPRGSELYACMTGTMRAGAAFVMAETGMDFERAVYIREDSGCKLYVDEECMKEILRLKPLEGYEPVNLHNLLYIAYTSGTTGHPKGVMHEYGSIDNAWRSVIFDGEPIFENTDTYLNTSPIHFVATPICLSFTCAFGSAIAMMPYHCRDDREAFSDYLEKAEVNCGYLTPTLLRRYLPFKQPWRMCVLASEPADGLFIPGMRCYNCCASSESGCWIGGYELTKEMTPALPAERVFHTKDAGKTDSDGNMILVGRIDEMFKVSGYRIEPAEVEKAVKSASGLKHMVVRGFVYKDISSITVFYTDDIALDPALLHEKLMKFLPEYMIPTNYIRLNEFPILPSGKIDKQNFFPPEGNWDQFKKNPVSVLPQIDKGETFETYNMGCGKAVRRFGPSTPFGRVWKELLLMQKSYENGTSAAKAYGIVRFESDYGILVDRNKS